MIIAPVAFEKHLTEEFTDEALDFIERYKEKPFFLFMSYNAPHTPLQPAEEHLERVAHIQDETRRLYAGLVVGLDDGVGQIMNKLRESGLEENTLVFFMSDNGGKLKWGADNGVLRKDKGSSYEGGWRVPFLMQWKGVISPSLYDQPVNSLDVLATIADLSGAPLDPKKPLDGVNLIPYVTDEKQGAPHRAVFLRGGGSKGAYAVRMGDYKIITYNGGTGQQMFNLKNDISEEHNIIKSLPERFKEIDSVRAEWSKGLIEPAYLGLEHTKKFKENNK